MRNLALIFHCFFEQRLLCLLGRTALSLSLSKQNIYHLRHCQIKLLVIQGTDLSFAYAYRAVMKAWNATVMQIPQVTLLSEDLATVPSQPWYRPSARQTRFDCQDHRGLMNGQGNEGVEGASIILTEWATPQVPCQGRTAPSHLTWHSPLPQPLPAW